MAVSIIYLTINAIIPISPMNKKSSYRPDIDGLRALAVVAIILFHFNVSGFSGGFTGVDIFFVISGYLITSIIIKEITQGTFSLADFWGRRIRRIIPALTVVTMTEAVASYFILILPSDLSDFGKTLMAQSFFVSNWWFMGISSYFSASVETMPMVHTWSLAIEEQFYFLLPLGLILTYKYIKKQAYLGIALGCVALLSFAYGIYLVHINPTEQFTIQALPHVWGSATYGSAGFYFILPRIWELLVGSIVAICVVQIKDKTIAEVTALSGLGIILIGIFLTTDSTPFPGVVAVLPVLGTAAIIIANTSHQTLVKTVLSLPKVVWIGLLSYSLYLWHWPLLVLARYYTHSVNDSMSSLDYFFLIALIYILSVCTYRYVETPFRQKTFFPTQKKMYLMGILSLVGVFCIGLTMVQQQGFPHRVSEGALIIADAMGDNNPRRDECFTKSSLVNASIEKPCLLGTQDSEYVDFVLWGDSHANAVMPAFDIYGQESNQTGVFFGASSCAPLVANRPISDDEVCLKEVERAVVYIQQNVPKEVFIVSEWTEGYPLVRSEYGPYLSVLLEDTINQLPEETQISVMLRIPTYPETSFRDHFFNAEHKSVSLNTKFPRAGFRSETQHIDTQIEQVALKHANVRILDPLETLCDTQYCYIGSEEGLFYRDSSHLSTFGAKTVILPLLRD